MPRSDIRFEIPPGGYPQANPDGTRAPATSRSKCVPSADAAREMSAYGEAPYAPSVMVTPEEMFGQQREGSRAQASAGMGGAYGNARETLSSDADAFDSNASAAPQANGS